MARRIDTDNLPWDSTDPNVETAKSYLNDPDGKNNQVTRPGWHDFLGRYYIQAGGLNPYECYRDTCGAGVYVVNWNWSPSDEERAATDWRKYLW